MIPCRSHLRVRVRRAGGCRSAPTILHRGLSTVGVGVTGSGTRSPVSTGGRYVSGVKSKRLDFLLGGVVRLCKAQPRLAACWVSFTGLWAFQLRAAKNKVAGSIWPAPLWTCVLFISGECLEEQRDPSPKKRPESRPPSCVLRGSWSPWASPARGLSRAHVSPSDVCV